jgi:hypothetical protein
MRCFPGLSLGCALSPDSLHAAGVARRLQKVLLMCGDVMWEGGSDREMTRGAGRAVLAG